MTLASGSDGGLGKQQPTVDEGAPAPSPRELRTGDFRFFCLPI
jgi:hypothetical protein